MAQPHRVPLAEVLEAVPVTPTEGAAILWQVAVRLERWLDARAPATLVVPGLADLSVARDGSVWWYRGRVVPRQNVVVVLGGLLEGLLQRAAGARVPPGLLYVLARSNDARHFAHFETVSDFRRNVGRHATDRPALVVDGLLARYFMRRAGCEPLGGGSTISDVRRLRRAGGVSLPRIAEDTGIPVSLLRELEWGVFANWNLPVARPALVAYAARAGLDPERVVTIVEREQQHVLVAATINPIFGINCGSHQKWAPLGLAAAMLALVIAGAPADRVPALEVRAAPAAAPVRAPEREPTILPATTREPEAPEPWVPAAPTARPRPAAQAPRDSRRTPGAEPARPRANQASHPLRRLARAIAGDGRHKVEPFPRPTHD